MTKMHMKILSLAIAALAPAAAFAQTTLRITEILQSNINATYEWPEFPDSWVEVQNVSGTPVDLSKWRIGETDFASAWPIDDTTLAPGAYRVVFCDKRSMTRHTDFRLDSGKGSVAIFAPDGSEAHRLDYPKQPVPNTAYALLDGKTWSYVVKPTPGAANTAAAANRVMPDPLFSHRSSVGVVGDKPFAVTVSIPEGEELPANSVLCVTTDGRFPSTADMVPGRTWTTIIDRSTVVRARIISPYALTALPVTRSYLFTPEPTELDVVCLATPPDYIFDKYAGIFGDLLMGDKKARRPVHIEYFRGPDHECLFSQMGETRVHGGSNKTMPQKSLAVYSHKRFGKKHFDGALWPDKPQVESAKSFVMRNGGNSWPYQRFNDQLLQTLIGRARPVEWQAYTPALYFINGRYMGIADIRERSNDELIESCYPGLTDIDMVENHRELKNGSMESHDELLGFLSSDSVSLDGIKRRVDLDNFIDLFAVETFCFNYDFPQNNIVTWRPKADGGKWRWVIKDLDDSGWWPRRDSVSHDYLARIDRIDRGDDRLLARRVKLFHHVATTFPEASAMLTDRLAVAMGDYLRLDHAMAVLDEMIAQVAPHYMSHLLAYSPDYAGKHFMQWQTSLTHWREIWWPQRIETVYRQLGQRYGLGEPVTLKICSEDPDAPLTFNGIALSTGSFDGKYWAGRTLRVATDETRQWLLTVTNAAGATTKRLIVADEVEIELQAGTLHAELTLTDRTGAIDRTEAETGRSGIYDLSGRRLATPVRGINIIGGRKVMVK